MKKTIIGAVVALVLALAGYGSYQTLGVAYNETQTKTLTATSTSQNVSAFSLKGKQNLTIAVVGSNATATVKFVGSINTTEPDPISTNSATNQWGYVLLTDLSTGETVSGATGLSLASGTTTKMYKLTQTNLSYLTPVITSYTTGTVSVMLMSDEGSNR